VKDLLVQPAQKLVAPHSSQSTPEIAPGIKDGDEGSDENDDENDDKEKEEGADTRTLAAVGEVKKGSKNIASKTTAGIASSVSKFTGVIGKTFSSVSGGKVLMGFTTPESTREGVYLGMKEMGAGFFSGLTGIVADPIEGARNKGIRGFAQGLATGVVGVAAKPVAGVFGCVSIASQGFATKHSGRGVPHRIRPPRFISPIHPVIKPYSRSAAEGQFLLKMAETAQRKKKRQFGLFQHSSTSSAPSSTPSSSSSSSVLSHSNPNSWSSTERVVDVEDDVYITSFDISEHHSIVLTNKQLMSIHKGKHGGSSVSTLWSVLIEDILSVEVPDDEKGVVILEVKQPQKSKKHHHHRLHLHLRRHHSSDSTAGKKEKEQDVEDAGEEATGDDNDTIRTVKIKFDSRSQSRAFVELLRKHDSLSTASPLVPHP